jgi:hypothetical protein
VMVSATKFSSSPEQKSLGRMISFQCRISRFTPNGSCLSLHRSGNFELVPQSGHPPFMGARGPRDDGFRCGSWINLDLSIGVASLKESKGAADDDLSWRSVILKIIEN